MRELTSRVTQTVTTLYGVATQKQGFSFSEESFYDIDKFEALCKRTAVNAKLH
jgi:hypothetical protein